MARHVIIEFPLRDHVLIRALPLVGSLLHVLHAHVIAMDPNKHSTQPLAEEPAQAVVSDDFVGDDTPYICRPIKAAHDEVSRALMEDTLRIARGGKRKIRWDGACTTTNCGAFSMPCIASR